MLCVSRRCPTRPVLWRPTSVLPNYSKINRALHVVPPARSALTWPALAGRQWLGLVGNRAGLDTYIKTTHHQSTCPTCPHPSYKARPTAKPLFYFQFLSPFYHLQYVCMDRLDVHFCMQYTTILYENRCTKRPPIYGAV